MGVDLIDIGLAYASSFATVIDALIHAATTLENMGSGFRLSESQEKPSEPPLSLCLGQGIRGYELHSYFKEEGLRKYNFSKEELCH